MSILSNVDFIKFMLILQNEHVDYKINMNFIKSTSILSIFPINNIPAPVWKTIINEKNTSMVIHKLLLPGVPISWTTYRYSYQRFYQK